VRARCRANVWASRPRQVQSQVWVSVRSRGETHAGVARLRMGWCNSGSHWKVETRSLRMTLRVGAGAGTRRHSSKQRWRRCTRRWRRCAVPWSRSPCSCSRRPGRSRLWMPVRQCRCPGRSAVHCTAVIRAWLSQRIALLAGELSEPFRLSNNEANMAGSQACLSRTAP